MLETGEYVCYFEFIRISYQDFVRVTERLPGHHENARSFTWE